MRYFVYEIEGVDVNFPFKAYPQQLEYMQQFIRSLKLGYNVALEAPTGFGKSLCVIAPYIAFQCMYSECLQIYEGLHKMVSKLDHKIMKKEFIEHCAITMDKEISKAEKIVDFLFTTVPFSNNIQLINGIIKIKSFDQKNWKTIRLVYTSRTHQQLQQVYKVISTYFPNCMDAVMYFAAKEHLCINQLTLQAAKEQRISINTLCKHHCATKQCPYNENKEVPIKAADLEDFKQKCDMARVCPYNVTRDFLIYNTIIICPYNYILDSINRNNDFHNVLINAIIVFDEAHSCYNNAKAVYEHEFTRRDVQEAVENFCLAMRVIDARWLHLGQMKAGGLQKVAEQYQNLFQKYRVLDVAQSIGKLLLGKFARLEKDAREELESNNLFKNQSFQVQDNFMYKYNQRMPWYKRESLDKLFQGSPLNIFNQECLEMLQDVDYYIYNTRQNLKALRPQLFNIDEQRLQTAKLGKSTVFRKLLEIYANSLFYDKKKNDIELVVQAEWVKQEQIQDNAEVMFNYLIQCYSPERAFKQLQIAGIRSFVFTSGTLRPLQSLDDQYGVKFSVKKSFGTVFQMKDRLDARIIEGIDHQTLISGEFQRRTSQYFDQVTQIIVKQISDVPKVGILVFLTSYDQVKQIETRLTPLQQENGFQLLVEKSNSRKKNETDNVKQQLNQYNNQIQDWELDFSDDNEPKSNTNQQYLNTYHQNNHYSQDSNQDTDLFKEIQYLVKEKRKKTLILAVLRGKLSEGIDFAGDLCRCVIIIGVPYLNRTDPSVSRQLAWLDEQQANKLAGTQNGISTLRAKPQQGNDVQQYSKPTVTNNDNVYSSVVFYTQQAFQAVCQALGRLIRSENDYGRVLLVDQRYTYLKQYLPSFLQNIPVQTLKDFSAQESRFFAQKEREMLLINSNIHLSPQQKRQHKNENDKSLSEFMSGCLSLSMSLDQSDGEQNNLEQQSSPYKEAQKAKEVTLEELCKTMSSGLNQRELFNPHYLRSQVAYLQSLNQRNNQLIYTVNNSANFNTSELQANENKDFNVWWMKELTKYLQYRGLMTEYQSILQQPIQIRAYNTAALINRLPYAYGIAIIAMAPEDVQEELYSCF